MAAERKGMERMRFAHTAPAFLLAVALLGGCNTTDVMTPQVDVGGGRFPNSQPVTDQDLQRMADTQQPVYPSGQPAQEQAYSEPVQTMPAGQQQAFGKPGPGAPPTTLSDQAARLGTPQPAGQTPAVPQTMTASAGGAETVRFLPIIGAPLEAVTPLSRQLGSEARSRGITIKGSGDNSADHMLKGYFSAVSGGGNITITYVWDVLDGKGARLNRLQGQETFPGDAADPWTAVPASVMQNIATKTMDSYLQWRQSL